MGLNSHPNEHNKASHGEFWHQWDPKNALKETVSLDAFQLCESSPVSDCVNSGSQACRDLFQIWPRAKGGLIFSDIVYPAPLIRFPGSNPVKTMHRVHIFGPWTLYRFSLSCGEHSKNHVISLRKCVTFTLDLSEPDYPPQTPLPLLISTDHPFYCSQWEVCQTKEDHFT